SPRCPDLHPSCQRPDQCPSHSIRRVRSCPKPPCLCHARFLISLSDQCPKSCQQFLSPDHHLLRDLKAPSQTPVFLRRPQLPFESCFQVFEVPPDSLTCYPTEEREQHTIARAEVQCGCREHPSAQVLLRCLQHRSRNRSQVLL